MTLTSTSFLDDLAQRIVARERDERSRASEVTQAALAIIDGAANPVGPLAPASVPMGAWWEQPAPVVLCDEFLAPAELAALRVHVSAVRDVFRPATLISGDSDAIYIDTSFRRSETVFDLGHFVPLFETRVSRYLDFACAQLGCPLFTRPTFELQLTAMPSGGFFREHDDNSHANNRSRRLTFVYYFFLQPLNWHGGALRFSPTSDRRRPLDVPPVENRLVFFNSALRHEVLPYSSDSGAFEGARFTVNGWVHQEQWP